MGRIGGNAAQGKYTWTVRVGNKGQIVIPKDARELFSIEPGDTLLLLGDVKQGIAIPPKDMTQNVINNILRETREAEEGK